MKSLFWISPTPYVFSSSQTEMWKLKMVSYMSALLFDNFNCPTKQEYLIWPFVINYVKENKNLMLLP